jgi:hypothetical protein
VLELPKALGRGLFCGGCDDQDGGWVTGLVPPVERKLPAVPQRLEQITNVFWHRARTLNSIRTGNLTHRDKNCKHAD